MGKLQSRYLFVGCLSIVDRETARCVLFCFLRLSCVARTIARLEKKRKKKKKKWRDMKNMVILVWNSPLESRVNICLFLFWLDNIWRACGKKGLCQHRHTHKHTYCGAHAHIYTSQCVLSWQTRALHQYLNKVLWHPFLLRPCRVVVFYFLSPFFIFLFFVLFLFFFSSP